MHGKITYASEGGHTSYWLALSTKLMTLYSAVSVMWLSCVNIEF